MTRRQKEPLRELTEEERNWLEKIARARSEPISHVLRAKEILSVAAGKTYLQAAQLVGRKSGDPVADLVKRFNQEGLNAIQPGHGGGPTVKYGTAERERILAEFRRQPDPERDGTKTWSLKTLERALRRAADGLPAVSADTIRAVLLEAGYSWQKSRSWCPTGQVVRKRKRGKVIVTDPEAEAKKNLIEQAYQVGEKLGLAVYTEDEAGPFQTIPYPGQSWQPAGQPERQPHEYLRNGTAKVLTLFHPVSGEVRVHGVERCTNAVLHPWLKAEVTQILNALPEAPPLDPETNRANWLRWQAGFSHPIPLPEKLPALRMLLTWDNLKGHHTPEMVCWLIEQGVMPLYTPLGGSWLNMAESIQRILVRRALEGQHPESPQEIIDALEAVARGWNREPTPFVWGGKRALRRQRSRQKRHALGGSGACTHRPIRSRATLVQKWQSTCQMTH